MDVLEFSKLYSDVHSPISLSIKFKPLAEPCEPGVHEDENTVLRNHESGTIHLN